MVKWIRDNTGRLPYRPFFEQDEIDYECESRISSFLQDRRGQSAFPISTDDLCVFLEQETDAVDFYADLTREGHRVEGMTEFFTDSKPKVSIAASLWKPGGKNRLRTTLMHEAGHVVFHSILSRPPQPSLFPTSDNFTPRCKRDTIIGTKKVDWMEWQAGYSSGAFLMPITETRQIVGEVLEATGSPGNVYCRSQVGYQIIQRVQSAFKVSAAAARVRLLQLGHLTEEKTPQPF